MLKNEGQHTTNYSQELSPFRLSPKTGQEHPYCWNAVHSKHSTLLDSAWAFTVSVLVGDKEASMAFKISSFDSNHCNTELASFWTSSILLRTAWRLSWRSRRISPSFSYLEFTSDMSHWISVRSSIREKTMRLVILLSPSFLIPKWFVRISTSSNSSSQLVIVFLQITSKLLFKYTK